MEKDAFIRWLDDKLAHDPSFETRMQAALKARRIERLAATILAVRARNRARNTSSQDHPTC